MKVLFEKTDSDNIVRITNGRRPTHLTICQLSYHFYSHISTRCDELCF